MTYRLPAFGKVKDNQGVWRVYVSTSLSDIRKHLATQICGKNFMQIINNAINIVERNNNDDSSDMFFEFPHEI